MKIIDLTVKYKHATATRKPNYKFIPVTVCELNESGAHEFNEIYDCVKEIKGLSTIKRSPSGGISYATTVFPAYDIRCTNAVVELTLLLTSGMFRFQFRTKAKEDVEGSSGMYGYQAFNIFKKKCKEQGIDLDSMAIDNGIEVKKTIEKPYIKLENQLAVDRIHYNANHIDFHNSYPAGLCNTHPEFRPVVEPLYIGRHDNPENKAVLNLTVGYMQSITCCGAKWAHLSKDAIADNNRRIEDLSRRLKESGRIVLLYNTDGIWYVGEPYHGEGEGKNLGDWENDHVNCKLRIKSKGSYEYIEDEVYHPVVRGMTRLDKIKPREEWSWGDIYGDNAEVLMFEYREGYGIYREGVKC